VPGVRSSVSLNERLLSCLPITRCSRGGKLEGGLGRLTTEGARTQVAIAKRGLPNSTEIATLEGRIDRSEEKFEKAILEFNDTLIRDPLNAGVVEDLAVSYFYLRRFRESEQTFERLVTLSPEQPMINVQKTCLIDFMEKGESKAIESVLSELPKEMAEDRAVLSLQLAFAAQMENGKEPKRRNRSTQLIVFIVSVASTFRGWFVSGGCHAQERASCHKWKFANDELACKTSSP
jgi:tetratricopeptide (TPR) repeat protein